jgi:hypothetical protein
MYILDKVCYNVEKEEITMKKTTEQKIAYHLKKLIEEVEKNGVNLNSKAEPHRTHKYFSVFEFKDAWRIGGHHNDYNFKKETKQ